MKNIITAAIIVILPIMAFANTVSEINRLMDRIKSNSKAYKVICYGDRNSLSNELFSSKLDFDNREEYCVFLKEEIETDIGMVLKLRGKK